MDPTISAIIVAQIDGLRSSAVVFAQQAAGARAAAADQQAADALARAHLLEAALLASGWEPPAPDSEDTTPDPDPGEEPPSTEGTQP